MFVILDFDGVLSDSIDPCCEEINRLRRESFPSIPLASGQQSLVEIFCGPLKTSLRRFGIKDDDAATFFDRHSEAMRARAKDINPFPGVEEFVGQLDRGRFAIVTSSYSEAVREILGRGCRRVDVQGIQILGRELRKTKDVKIRMIAAEKGLNVENMIKVGDLVSDIIYARSCGIPIATVSWGYHTYDYLYSFNPDYMITNFNDLLDVIN